MTESDETLFRLAQKGDRAALEALLERHLPALRAYIRLRMGPRVRRWEAESDLAQSVCAEAIGNLDDIEYRNESAFRQWLFSAALHKLVTKDRYFRAQKRDTDRVLTNLPGPEGTDPMVALVCRNLATPSEHAEEREAMERVERALDQMSETEREVILLSRLAGRSTREIAEHMDRSEAAVRALLARALATLSRHLASGQT
jgi:RNA polymerase sigma-70 factor (ECF subfamily)